MPAPSKNYSKTLSEDTLNTLLDFDLEHIWHPYSSLLAPQPIYPVDSASGVHLYLCDGRTLIDGMSSWWSALHGYNHPELNRAAHAQIDKMSHVMFGGLTHEPAVELCKKLVDITPKALDKVFLADSGSVAVEVAIKMALQYWHSKAQPQKNKLLALRGGYHGDTFGAMAVCDPVNGMHHLFTSNLAENIFARAPGGDFNTLELEALADLEEKVEHHHHSIAAIILEPIVQGAGGMRFYSPEYLKAVRSLCDQYQLLLIADEIATGFGRTGKLFACEHANIEPDILCVGKALTGGYMTLAATLCTSTISSTICKGEAGVFMHGPTFMGNPLACAVACSSIDLLLNSPWQARVQTLEEQLQRELSPLINSEKIADVRVLGAIAVVEMKKAVDMSVIQEKFVNKGVWLRPFGKLVYIMPPFIMSGKDLSTVTTAMVDILSGKQSI